MTIFEIGKEISGTEKMTTIISNDQLFDAAMRVLPVSLRNHSALRGLPTSLELAFQVITS